MYILSLIFLPVVLVTAFPVDSSDDSLFGSDAFGGFADKVRGWTETAWANSKVGIKFKTNCNKKPNHFNEITIQNKSKSHNRIGQSQRGQVRRQGRGACPRLEETLGSGRTVPRDLLPEKIKRWPVMPVRLAMTAWFSCRCCQWLPCWHRNKFLEMFNTAWIYPKLHTPLQRSCFANESLDIH